MTSSYYTIGNAIRDGEGNLPKGWFIGHFVPREYGLRSCDAVEVKWGVHRAGEAKATPSTNDHQSTLTLLVSGRFALAFTGLDRSVTLADPGDYVIFADGVRHHWKCLEDSVVLTVRWPSAQAR